MHIKRLRTEAHVRYRPEVQHEPRTERPVCATEPWGQRTCYIADPEGNLIEIGSFTNEGEMQA